jgi:EAL domain-containing protein (putative c-di-GMP-specific phosphodiesterase class I)
VLAETKLPGKSLALEITESTAMRDVESTLRTLTELSAMGVRISIDDFGNRYSALGYLKRFPFSSLKIDQSFVRNIAQDSNNAALTTAIIDMARTLRLRVIAEGVETQDQLDFLRDRHCDEVQGYLLSRPLTAPAFQQLLVRAGERRFVRN